MAVPTRRASADRPDSARPATLERAPGRHGACVPRSGNTAQTKGGDIPVAKVVETSATSPKGFEDAIKRGRARVIGIRRFS